MAQAKTDDKKQGANSFDVKQLKDKASQYSAVLSRHGFFLYIMLLVIGLGVCVYMAVQAFSVDKASYRTQKLTEVKQSYQLDRAKDVEDQVLQSRTAGAGPIKPNYDPDRDNPFVE